MLNPRIDIAFKKIFGSEDNKDLLISFINSVVSFDDQVVDIEVLNPFVAENYINDKFSILDIKAKDSQGKLFDIEVQICKESDYEKRSLYYWSKLYSEQQRKTIAIHVLNFTYFPHLENYRNKFIITEETSQKRFFNDFTIYTVELSKFERKNKSEDLTSLLPKIKTGLDRWAAFLTKAAILDRKKLPKELAGTPIEKALTVLTTFSLAGTDRDLYEDHLKWLRMEASAICQSKAEGKAEKAQEIAKKCLEQKMSISAISAITGLTEEESYSLLREKG
jgi:predicted transposase/invertase (TIGR01784 family)